MSSARDLVATEVGCDAEGPVSSILDEAMQSAAAKDFDGLRELESMSE